MDTKSDVNEHFSHDLYWYLRKNGQEYFKTIASFCVGRTLDIGCGEAHLRHYIKDYMGFDLSDVAVKKVNDPRVIVGDLNNLPDLGNFDTIVMCGFMFYFTIPEIKSHIAKIRDKYNPSRIVLADPIKVSWEVLNPKEYKVITFNLTNKDLPNGSKNFINNRQIAIL